MTVRSCGMRGQRLGCQGRSSGGGEGGRGGASWWARGRVLSGSARKESVQEGEGRLVKREPQRLQLEGGALLGAEHACRCGEDVPLQAHLRRRVSIEV